MRNSTKWAIENWAVYEALNDTATAWLIDKFDSLIESIGDALESPVVEALNEQVTKLEDQVYELKHERDATARDLQCDIDGRDATIEALRKQLVDSEAYVVELEATNYELREAKGIDE